MKKINIYILIFLVICVSIVTVEATSDEVMISANALNELGLFNGVGIDEYGNPIYDLERQPTRNEAVTMLVRLLGKENEALSNTWDNPFVDVDEWAQPYVGYAYANGLTNGISSTTFGGNNAISATQYLTFILRVLGYKDGTDFQWDTAWVLTDQLGITSGEYTELDATFLRGDIALVSYAALQANIHYSNKTLADILIEDGVFSQIIYKNVLNSLSTSIPLSFDLEYAYISLGEQIQLSPNKSIGIYEDLNWTSSSNYFSVDNNGVVSVNRAGGASTTITATTSTGEKANCVVMMQADESATIQLPEGEFYIKFPTILALENVSEDIALWQEFDVSYPEFGIYSYNYSYLVDTLTKAEILAETYSKWLEHSGYLIRREEDDPMIQQANGNDMIYELIDPLNEYVVEIKGSTLSGGSGFDVTVSISYAEYISPSSAQQKIENNEGALSEITTYEEYNDVPDFTSINGDRVVIDSEFEKAYISNSHDEYIRILNEYGFSKVDSYTEKYEDCQLSTKYGTINIYRNNNGREVHVLTFEDKKLNSVFVIISIDNEIKKPLISQAVSLIVSEQNKYEDNSSIYKYDFNNYKYGHTDTIHGSPIYVVKSKVDSIQDFQKFLNEKYEVIYSPMEDFTVDIEIWDNSTSQSGQAFNIHVDFSFTSTKDWSVITPYSFADEYGYTDEEKEDTYQMIKDMLIEISDDAIDCFPEANVSGSIYVSGYHYRNIKVDYYSDLTLSWNRTGDDFEWLPSLDTFTLWK